MVSAFFCGTTSIVRIFFLQRLANQGEISVNASKIAGSALRRENRGFGRQNARPTERTLPRDLRQSQKFNAPLRHGVTGLLDPADTDVFRFHVVIEAVFRPFTSNAAFFHTAERRNFGRDQTRVEPTPQTYATNARCLWCSSNKPDRTRYHWPSR